MFTSTKKESKEEKIPNANNIIGKGAHLEGNLHTIGNLRVEGKITGEIKTKAKVVLGNTAEVQGKLIAQDAEVGGNVQGTIMVAGLLTLKPTAVVQGDIMTSKLVIEEGAKFNGKCQMGTQAKEVTMKPPDTPYKNTVSPVEKKNSQAHSYPKEKIVPSTLT